MPTLDGSREDARKSDGLLGVHLGDFCQRGKPPFIDVLLRQVEHLGHIDDDGSLRGLVAALDVFSDQPVVEQELCRPFPLNDVIFVAREFFADHGKSVCLRLLRAGQVVDDGFQDDLVQRKPAVHDVLREVLRILDLLCQEFLRQIDFEALAHFVDFVDVLALHSFVDRPDVFQNEVDEHRVRLVVNRLLQYALGLRVQVVLAKQARLQNLNFGLS